MDFRLNDDQLALQDTVRSLVEGRMPLDRLRQCEDAEEVVDRSWWNELGSAGVFALMVPEAGGGVGLGEAEAVVVFEELGRALVPGPLVATALAAGLVDGAADGTVPVGTLARPRPGSPFPVVVEHLATLQALLVVPGAAVGREEVGLADLASLRPSARRLSRTLDPLTPLWEVAPGTAIEERALDPALSGTEVSELMRRGMVLTAALQVGGASRCVELATAYAGERQQFGRPIGSFQAVKHLCADMLVRSEVARCAVHAAAALADQPEAARAEARANRGSATEICRRAAASAKLLADEAAIANARTCIQVHGGMGFTWELPIHLYLKRAHLRSAAFGSPSETAELVAALM